MAAPVPSGFDRSAVLAGLYTAMAFGAPTKVADRATFVMPRTETIAGTVDGGGVPFDPDVRPVFSVPSRRTVPCAVEYIDAIGKVENFGIIAPSRVRITLLSPDYDAVEGFEYVVIAGQKYLYRKTEPVVALGSIDVWTVHCQAEDES